MKSVKEVSQLSGVSVRTLHYYDEIDLLKPSVVAENGYRYYNRDAVVRLQEILLYRELDFPLKKIKEIVGQAGYDKVQALKDQIKLLELKKSRLEAVIAHAKALQMEEEEMSFEAFDKKCWKNFSKKPRLDGVRQKLIKLLRLRERSPSLKSQKRWSQSCLLSASSRSPIPVMIVFKNK